MAGVATAFGLLKYRNTENLGDEIQSLAARRFLPRVDRTIDRDRLHWLGWKGAPLKLIMNGWFTHRPEHWPPHPAIDPLLLSFHLSDQMTPYGFSAAEALVVGENAAWLRAHGPVGARDEWTLDLLHRNGIDAWLSGCLTLTLERPADVPRERYIVLNDVDDEIHQLTRKHTRAAIVKSTHLDRTTRSAAHRFAKAEQLLRLYAGAGYVVTSRLHCALPCLAMGTPLLLVQRETPGKRFSGLSRLVPTVVQAEYADRLRTLRLDRPPANPSNHLAMRDDLERRCRHFASNTIS
jgi:hypothetical protein